jgi:hypothetical protein
LKMTLSHLLENLAGLKLLTQAKMKEPSIHIIHAILHMSDSMGIAESRVKLPGVEPIAFERVKSYLGEIQEQLLVRDFLGATKLVVQLIGDLERCGIKGKLRL